jgi:hypothetical protein
MVVHHYILYMRFLIYFHYFVFFTVGYYIVEGRYITWIICNNTIDIHSLSQWRRRRVGVVYIKWKKSLSNVTIYLAKTCVFKPEKYPNLLYRKYKLSNYLIVRVLYFNFCRYPKYYVIRFLVNLTKSSSTQIVTEASNFLQVSIISKEAIFLISYSFKNSKYLYGYCMVNRYLI